MFFCAFQMRATFMKQLQHAALHPAPPGIRCQSTNVLCRDSAVLWKSIIQIYCQLWAGKAAVAPYLCGADVCVRKVRMGMTSEYQKKGKQSKMEQQSCASPRRLVLVFARPFVRNHKQPCLIIHFISPVSLEKQNNRKSLSSQKIIPPHSTQYSITLIPLFSVKKEELTGMCVIALWQWSAELTKASERWPLCCVSRPRIHIHNAFNIFCCGDLGRRKEPDSFKNTGTSTKSCLKGRANSLMKLAWYVCAHKVLSCAITARKNRRRVLKRTAGMRKSRRAWILYRAGLCLCTKFNIVATQDGYYICLYLRGLDL